jgi:hypothetical protein
VKSNDPETVTFGNREFEVVWFNSKITNRAIALKGVGLAQGYLAVAPGFRIYNTKTGCPIIRGRFKTFGEALRFALWLELVYTDFFPIWEDYPDADIISWCKYSVKDGLILYEMIEELNRLDEITDYDVARAEKIGREAANIRWKL